jgi:choline-sulfatase
VARTVVALGGGKTPKDWNGDSMVNWLDHPDARWKDRAVSEYYGHNIASGYAMIRLGPFKYVYHTAPDADHAAERELYDLAADPGELHNLAMKPDHAERVASMHAALVKELGEEPDTTEQRCRADYAKGYDRKNEDGSRKVWKALKKRATAKDS